MVPATFHSSFQLQAAQLPSSSSSEQDTDRGAKDEGTEEGGVPLSMSVCALSLLLLYLVYACAASSWCSMDDHPWDVCLWCLLPVHARRLGTPDKGGDP